MLMRHKIVNRTEQVLCPIFFANKIIDIVKWLNSLEV